MPIIIRLFVHMQINQNCIGQIHSISNYVSDMTDTQIVTNQDHKDIPLENKKTKHMYNIWIIFFVLLHYLTLNRSHNVVLICLFNVERIHCIPFNPI